MIIKILRNAKIKYKMSLTEALEKVKLKKVGIPLGGNVPPNPNIEFLVRPDFGYRSFK